MDKYVAFLRGINISGKNKISMQELKTSFETLGFCDVKTYLNSGNVVFSSENNNTKAVLEQKILDTFGVLVPVCVIALDELKGIIAHAPDWWNSGNKEMYDNLIFILSDDTPESVCEMVGAPSEGLEKVQIYNNVIFWTFDREAYRKCNWWKRTAAPGIADKLTIRTANTIKKVL